MNSGVRRCPCRRRIVDLAAHGGSDRPGGSDTFDDEVEPYGSGFAAFGRHCDRDRVCDRRRNTRHPAARAAPARGWLIHRTGRLWRRSGSRRMQVIAANRCALWHRKRSAESKSGPQGHSRIRLGRMTSDSGQGLCRSGRSDVRRDVLMERRPHEPRVQAGGKPNQHATCGGTWREMRGEFQI